jgi:RND family efflux transporter MFP subunit
MSDLARPWTVPLLLAMAGAAGAQPLETAPVQYREVDITYAAEAVVEATRQSTVSAQVTGRVVEVRFDVGDVVAQGQVIARIDSSQARQVVAGSQAQVSQAQAAYENARAEFERTRDLARQKFVSQATLDRAEAALRVAKAQVESARAGAGEAETAKGFTTVVAPFGGVVAARHIEVGEMAVPGKPLFTGFDPRELRVIASIPQYKVADIRTSPRVSVELPSVGKRVAGSNLTVLPAADARTHSTRVRVDLPAGMKDVVPGVYARAHFTVGRARKLVMPEAAAVHRSEVTGAYVVGAGGKVSFRQIRLGEPAGDGLVEVLAGLMPGEKVATAPVKASIALAQGTKSE